MSARIRQHLRSNVVGYIAVFIALSGTAYAVDGPLPGQNQVGSADIINGEVQSADIKDANLTTADIRAGAVTNGKLADSAVTTGTLADGAVTTGKIADGAVQSADVLEDGLLGDDIFEASLGTVPSADQAANAANAAKLDGIDSTGYLQQGANAGGDLTGNLPNPTLRPSEAPAHIGAPGNVPFENGWGNYAPIGEFWAPASAYRDRLGIVHLSGLVTGGTYGSAHTTGRIFALQGDSYEPCHDLIFGTISSGAIGQITVVVIGGITRVGAQIGSGWISLDGISWRARSEGC